MPRVFKHGRITTRVDVPVTPKTVKITAASAGFSRHDGRDVVVQRQNRLTTDPRPNIRLLDWLRICFGTALQAFIRFAWQLGYSLVGICLMPCCLLAKSILYDDCLFSCSQSSKQTAKRQINCKSCFFFSKSVVRLSRRRRAV